MSVDVKARNWNYDKNFAIKFLESFGDKEPQWLEVAYTIIDSTNYFADEQET
jgi:transposase-like protein